MHAEVSRRTGWSETGVPGAAETWMNMKERWLSVEEIAAHLGVNPDTIYKWIERKKLPAHKMGRLWKFMASEVDEWVRAGKAGGDGGHRK
jgi:excisionase family DNA binding protein